MNQNYTISRRRAEARKRKRLLVKRAQPPGAPEEMEEPQPGAPGAPGDVGEPGPGEEPGGPEDLPGPGAPPDTAPPGAPGDPNAQPMGPVEPVEQPEVNIDSETGKVHITKGDPNNPMNIHVSRKRAAGDPGSKTPSNGGWEPFFTEGAPDMEDDPLATDTHDDIHSGPANRQEPPLFEVEFTAESEARARAMARSINYMYGNEIELDGTKVTVKGLLQYAGLLHELRMWNVDAKVTSHSTNELLPTAKVAVVQDFPEMNYRYNPDHPAIASVVSVDEDDGILLEHVTWGRFYAEPHEIALEEGT